MSRAPFQGVAAVVRFNWHLYAVALGGVSTLVLASAFGPARFALPALLIASAAALSLGVSLLATWLAYDASGLYRLRWLDAWLPARGEAANIHAGFDETTPLLRARFPQLHWTVFDFFNPVQHTEISIRRARASCPPAAGTTAITTDRLPAADSSLACITLILAAHEIRDPRERIAFFRELHRALRPDGLLVVTEHLRDLPNIAVYNLGAWHFHAPAAWRETFAATRFGIVATFRPAPFITTFILKKHGHPA